MPYGPKPVAADERFLRYVRKTKGCWIWTGAIKANGYGQFNVVASRKGHRTTYAHRFAYELWVGPLPENARGRISIDHLCRNRACVRPDHLELVTHAENLNRGEHRNRKKDRCLNGHPFDGVNRIGTRTCSICTRERNRKWREEHREYWRMRQREYQRRHRAKLKS